MCNFLQRDFGPANFWIARDAGAIRNVYLYQLTTKR